MKSLQITQPVPCFWEKWVSHNGQTQLPSPISQVNRYWSVPHNKTKWHFLIHIQPSSTHSRVFHLVLVYWASCVSATNWILKEFCLTKTTDRKKKPKRISTTLNTEVQNYFMFNQLKWVGNQREVTETNRHAVKETLSSGPEMGMSQSQWQSEIRVRIEWKSEFRGTIGVDLASGKHRKLEHQSDLCYENLCGGAS